MSEMPTDEEMREFQQELWDLFTKRIGPEADGHLLMVAGTMIESAVELYTCVLSDEDITRLFKEIIDTIPECREKMAARLGTLTIH